MHDTAKADGAAFPVANIAIKHLERVYSETREDEAQCGSRVSGILFVNNTSSRYSW
jgi:hypothetical protein